jgi:predicted HD superfamily hydrolase involved in NAD metabolism
MTESEIRRVLEKRLGSKPYRHSIATGEMSRQLARIYGIDEQKAFLTGLLHDCAKGMPRKDLIQYAQEHEIPIDYVQLNQPNLLHGVVGASIAMLEFEISDNEILHAIETHSTGVRNMSLLDKVLFLSDSAEPNRDYSGVEKIRKLALSGKLDTALLEAMERKLIYVMKKRLMLHPTSIEAWNDIAEKIKTP